ncbi:ABC transporter ATP-binding protein [Peribacillus cavernae]|uniref:ABC transporter ATP-binding protein n=1 Tax=Peribacillus cavernae TaxID=1674310 RepID=A0A3S0TWV2_9BACI|nr:ABC transporter ATP-binding protein [Peribacillus cavernae]MDQ0221399.1 oligopeptide/dipeptide ABC transporter ATP-binding protein [Peribacillus cavernae]RUQ25793.1 ABC transporter ATP-binding protein [Peribacillus cavernae]
MKNLLDIKGIKKHFPVRGTKDVVTAVNDISFNIREGETFGLIGESGSGKSSVGRCILNLISPTSGEMRYKGMEYSKFGKKEAAVIRTEMQMVFQDPYYSLNPRKTVWETVEDTLRVNKNLAATDRKKMTVDALAKVQFFENDYEKYPHQLSAGQQQRVGIARAIAPKPKFIVLDEPTSSLDLSVRAEIIDLLVKLQKDSGITYLFISHDLSTIQFLCHRVAVMYLGRIVEYGDVNEVFHNHRHPYSKALLASVMKPDPKIPRSDYRLSGEIPSPINLPKGCHLASRCPEVEAKCREIDPPFIDVGNGHFVNCHHAAPLEKERIPVTQKN